MPVFPLKVVAATSLASAGIEITDRFSDDLLDELWRAAPMIGGQEDFPPESPWRLPGKDFNPDALGLFRLLAQISVLVAGRQANYHFTRSAGLVVGSVVGTGRRSQLEVFQGDRAALHAAFSALDRVPNVDVMGYEQDWPSGWSPPAVRALAICWGAVAVDGAGALVLVEPFERVDWARQTPRALVPGEQVYEPLDVIPPNLPIQDLLWSDFDLPAEDRVAWVERDYRAIEVLPPRTELVIARAQRGMFEEDIVSIHEAHSQLIYKYGGVDAIRSMIELVREEAVVPMLLNLFPVATAEANRVVYRAYMAIPSDMRIVFRDAPNSREAALVAEMWRCNEGGVLTTPRTLEPFGPLDPKLSFYLL